MAPLNEILRRNFDAGAPARAFKAQWSSMGDVFSVLLILGGDVIERALAQLVGSGITPVAFSFGTWGDLILSLTLSYLPSQPAS